MNKMWSIHVMEYYSATKNKGLIMCYDVDEL